MKFTKDCLGQTSLRRLNKLVDYSSKNPDRRKKKRNIVKVRNDIGRLEKLDTRGQRTMKIRKLLHDVIKK